MFITPIATKTNLTLQTKKINLIIKISFYSFIKLIYLNYECVLYCIKMVFISWSKDSENPFPNF